MAAVGVEEDPAAVQAARILLGLRKVNLLRWPERVQKDSAAAAAVEEGEAPWPPEWWPKGQRSRRRLHGDWTAALPIPKLAAVGVSVGSGACSSGGEEQDQRWSERRSVRYEVTAAPSARRQGSPSYYVAPPSGSTPSTSADRKSRPRRAVEKAPLATAAAVAVLPKETMKASSPETPLDFAAAAAAGSGASSSGDSRPPSKRRADDGALGSGSGAASSGDEGCSSPGKRPRVDDDGEKAISTRDDVKFAFDLNMPCPEDQEEFPGFC